jgi:hypothetical protein
MSKKIIEPYNRKNCSIPCQYKKNGKCPFKDCIVYLPSEITLYNNTISKLSCYDDLLDDPTNKDQYYKS